MKQHSDIAMRHYYCGTLFVVATPIGNMGDITLRAIETLKNVDLVASEDTRVTGLLLYKLEIKKPMRAIHQHSRDGSITDIIDLLLGGKNVAYVTDSGTPGISDPGQALIMKIRELNNKRIKEQKNNIEIIPIPGASAVAAAVSISGMVEKEFYFAGFLPKKKGRQTELKYLSTLKVPVVVYESAVRLERTLNDIKEYFGHDTKVFIAREMTKMFEEYWGGNITEVLGDLKNHKLKGEIVIIVQISKIKM